MNGMSPEARRGGQIPLELELQALVNHPVSVLVLGIQLESSVKVGDFLGF